MTPLEHRALAELATRSPAWRATDLSCCSRCWTVWLRARLLEHLRGERHWAQLDRGDFGLLRGHVHANGTLVVEITELVAAGYENIEVLAWAIRTGRAIDDVITILARFDVNARRIRRFTWLGEPFTECRARRGRGLPAASV